MAKPRTETTTVYNIDLPVTVFVKDAILELVEDQSLTDAQKIGGVALTLLNQQAAGGIMLTRETLSAIEQSAGVEITEESEIPTLISEAVGRKDGMIMIPYYLDPADEPAHQDIADIQGRPLVDIIQDIIDYVIQNQMVYNYPAERQPDIVRMTKDDKRELESILEGTFTNGTELAALVSKRIVADGLDMDLFSAARES